MDKRKWSNLKDTISDVGAFQFTNHPNPGSAEGAGEESRASLHRSRKCSDPSYESDPSNEYSPLGLTHVMNSTFLDPSNEFLTQAVNIGIPKQTLGLCFHVSK